MQPYRPSSPIDRVPHRILSPRFRDLVWMSSLLAAGLFARADGFQSGSLVVLQMGDGSGALTSAAAPVSLLEYDTTGQLRQSLAVPGSGSPARLTVAGSSTSEGYLSLSADLTALAVVGYDAAIGTAAVASASSATVNRVVDVVSAGGGINRFAASASLLSGQNIRSGVIAGSDAWAVGSAAGVSLLTGAAPGSLYNGITTLRVANVFNGDLFFSTQSGTTTRGIYQFNGLPTAAATPTQLITTDSASRPVDFSFSADASVAYIADERTTGGGVEKWSRSGGVWTLSYTLSAGSSRGARGLAVDFSGLNPVVYATTTQNELIKIVDSGGASVPSVLATAPANVEWRGLEIAPIPEPGETAVVAGSALVGVAAWHRRRRVKSAPQVAIAGR